ncbi:hypothetical protein CSOJ01_00241 [Colletotrichum sojae]|uniref:Uncharacterized protein n=1 Tax=Colletotrichum sojae TaxID=2175907 RepID=A0A8H6JYS4_9PEZI|nr:hypothetical protein CSOJ01_00241 [Colletotrichum sojae]
MGIHAKAVPQLNRRSLLLSGTHDSSFTRFQPAHSSSGSVGFNATDLASSESPLGFGVGCRMGDDASASPQSYRHSTEAWRRLRVLNARTPLSYVAPKVGCNAPGTDPDPVAKVGSLSDVNGDDPAINLRAWTMVSLSPHRGGTGHGLDVRSICNGMERDASISVPRGSTEQQVEPPGASEKEPALPAGNGRWGTS